MSMLSLSELKEDLDDLAFEQLDLNVFNLQLGK